MKKQLKIGFITLSILAGTYGVSFAMDDANNVASNSFVSQMNEKDYSQILNISQIKKGNAYIPKGTDISLELLDPIGSKKSKEGDTFRLKTTDNLLINNVVVVPKDTIVFGRITKARKNGGFGRKGRLEFVINSIKSLNGIDIPVHTEIEGAGRTDGGAVAVATFVTLVGGIFMKGTNIDYNPGQLFNVYVTKDVDLDASINNLAEEMSVAKPRGKNIILN